ncbi:type VI secretion system contractile sheath small subunit [Hydrogenimonas sp.]
MSNQSESPKERINVTYKPATGDATEEIEIPYRLLVLGEFNPDEEFTTVEEKKSISVTKSNFDDVLGKQDIRLNISVDNKLSDEEGGTLEATLSFNSMKDFTPENIVDQVEELRKLKELRDSLMSLKGPLGNIPAFRKAIAQAIENPEEAAKILQELGINEQ